MRARCGLLAIAASVLLCTGCWLPGPTAARPPAKTTVTTPPAQAPASPTATSPPHHWVAPSTRAPFSTAPAGLRRLARRFVSAVSEYDATTEGRLDFLAKARAYATRAELRRLAVSSRARLPWPVLRARAERVHVHVVGVSTDTRQSGAAETLLVEAIATTRTSFATVRGMEQLRLTIARTPQGWRVTDARGAGL